MRRPKLPPELLPYHPAVNSAVARVQTRVTGAASLGTSDLYQEAWAIVTENRGAWERQAEYAPAYARADILGRLSNRVREILRTDGRYGKTGGAWGARRPVLDPASRLGAVDPDGAMIAAIDGPSGDRDGYPRSPRWARTFRETFPVAAEEFLALSDRGGRNAERARLRFKHAAAFAAVDAMEARREDVQLLDAMFGQAA
jgi:hypothetical protein